MQLYANLGGDSGIVNYTTTADSITVGLSDGAAYRYTYARTGASDIEQLKTLARAGQGLNEYINRYVKKRYAKKLR